MALWRVHTLTDKQTPANIGRIPMQSAFGKRCKRLHINAFQCLALTSNTVSGGNIWRHYFFLNDEFEITVVLDDRNVELRIKVSVSMPGKKFYSLKSSFLHTAGDN